MKQTKSGVTAIIADLCLPRNGEEGGNVKIRWFEVLVLALTVLTVLVFVLNYLATVNSGEITVTVWRNVSAWRR